MLLLAKIDCRNLPRGLWIPVVDILMYLTGQPTEG